MAFNHEEFLKFALTAWIKDKKSLKYFLFLVLFNAVLLIVTNLCMYTLLEPFSKAAMVNPNQLGYAMVYLFVFIISIVFIGVVIPMIIVYFIYTRALELTKRSFVQLTGIRILKVFVLSLASSIISFLSLFRVRWLLLLLASVGMLVVSLVTFTIAGAMSYNYNMRMFQNGVALFGIALLLFSFLGFLAYLIVVFYNSLRLSLSTIIFIEKEKKVLACLKESWDLTSGKIVNSFWLFVVLMILMIIVNGFVSLPLQIYTGQLDPMGVSKTPLQELNQMVDPIVIVLTCIMVLFQIMIAMVEIFGLIFIYDQLRGLKGQKREESESKRKMNSKTKKVAKKSNSVKK